MKKLFMPPISKSRKPKVKSRVRPAFKNVLRKSSCFWKSSLKKQPLWLGFWLFGPKAKAKNPTKHTLNFLIPTSVDINDAQATAEAFANERFSPSIIPISPSGWGLLRHKLPTAVANLLSGICSPADRSWLLGWLSQNWLPLKSYHLPIAIVA